MYLVINKCVTAVKVSNFSGHYLRNRSTLDIGVLVYIGIVQHKEHSPEVLSIPPGTPCINKQHDYNCFFLYLSVRQFSKQYEFLFLLGTCKIFLMSTFFAVSCPSTRCSTVTKAVSNFVYVFLQFIFILSDFIWFRVWLFSLIVFSFCGLFLFVCLLVLFPLIVLQFLR